jgi:hypothetical protein
MRLWILTRKGVGYEEVGQALVRAETEDDARVLASDLFPSSARAAWLDPSITTCDELVADGPEGVLIEVWTS